MGRGNGAKQFDITDIERSGITFFDSQQISEETARRLVERFLQEEGEKPSHLSDYIDKAAVLLSRDGVRELVKDETSPSHQMIAHSLLGRAVGYDTLEEQEKLGVDDRSLSDFVRPWLSAMHNIPLTTSLIVNVDGDLHLRAQHDGLVALCGKAITPEQSKHLMPRGSMMSPPPRRKACRDCKIHLLGSNYTNRVPVYQLGIERPRFPVLSVKDALAFREYLFGIASSQLKELAPIPSSGLHQAIDGIILRSKIDREGVIYAKKFVCELVMKRDAHDRFVEMFDSSVIHPEDGSRKTIENLRLAMRHAHRRPGEELCPLDEVGSRMEWPSADEFNSEVIALTPETMQLDHLQIEICARMIGRFYPEAIPYFLEQYPGAMSSEGVDCMVIWESYPTSSDVVTNPHKYKDAIRP
jgi:hypothetical protein